WKAAAGAGHDENGYLPADEVGRESRQSIELSIRPPVLDRHVPSFDIALSIQSPAKRRQHVGIGFGIPAAEPSDHRYRRLLRVCGERPCCHAAKCSDEFAPSKAHLHLPVRALNWRGTRPKGYHSAVARTLRCSAESWHPDRRV